MQALTLRRARRREPYAARVAFLRTRRPHLAARGASLGPLRSRWPRRCPTRRLRRRRRARLAVEEELVLAGCRPFPPRPFHLRRRPADARRDQGRHQPRLAVSRLADDACTWRGPAVEPRGEARGVGQAAGRHARRPAADALRGVGRRWHGSRRRAWHAGLRQHGARRRQPRWVRHDAPRAVRHGRRAQRQVQPLVDAAACREEHGCRPSRTPYAVEPRPPAAARLRLVLFAALLPLDHRPFLSAPLSILGVRPRQLGPSHAPHAIAHAAGALPRRRQRRVRVALVLVPGLAWLPERACRRASVLLQRCSSLVAVVGQDGVPADAWLREGTLAVGEEPHADAGVASRAPPLHAVGLDVVDEPFLSLVCSPSCASLSHL